MNQKTYPLDHLINKRKIMRKKKPQDATLRNINALKKRVAKLETIIRELFKVALRNVK